MWQSKSFVSSKLEWNEYQENKPEAAPRNRPIAFSVDPNSCIGQGNDHWEDNLNPMMKGAFGWGEDAMLVAIKAMLQRGQCGLDAFI